MKTWTILTCTIVALLLLGDAEARKSVGGGRRSGGWGWGASSKSNTNYQGSRRTSQTKPPARTTARPSAPVQENVAKSSVSNVQSGYSPSGGYPRQPATNPNYPGPNSQPGYNPSPGGHSPYGQGYNPPVGHSPYGQGYNPSVGQSYHPPGHYNPPGAGQPYNPSYGSPYNQPHSPSFGSPYSPSVGQMPAQTILVQSGQSRPGIGQLAKEAFVFAGVSAGVNAAVNRIIPGGIYGTRGSDSGSSGSGGAGSHTSITYNNYYNNGTAASPGGDQAAAPASNPQSPPAAAPAPNPAAPGEPMQTAQTSAPNNNAPAQANSQDNAQNNNPNPLGYVTSNDDLKKLTESLFEKDVNNANKFITVNLQGQKKDESTNDDAPEPLLTVKSEAFEIPTVKAVLALHDNYEWDVKTKETVTSEERREESEFLDKVLETEVMKLTMKFLAEKGYIPDDEYEFKDGLKRIWFSQFKRIDGDASSSGFETVFLAEKFDSDIIGLHDWIYYYKQEEAKKLNYLGYIKEQKLGEKGSVLKIRSSLNDIVQPVTTIFVGTSPELELALYTMCFFTRPNNVCPVSLGGTEFMVIVNRVNYFGKDILISAYPDI